MFKLQDYKWDVIPGEGALKRNEVTIKAFGHTPGIYHKGYLIRYLTPSETIWLQDILRDMDDAKTNELLRKLLA